MYLRVVVDDANVLAPVQVAVIHESTKALNENGTMIG
jgi:hypothetical protein